MTSRLLGSFGWILVVASLLLIISVSISLPTILMQVKLDITQKLGVVSRVVVQITAGVFASTGFLTVTRFFLKIWTTFKDPDMGKAHPRFKDAVNIQLLLTWASGIMGFLTNLLVSILGGGF